MISSLLVLVRYRHSGVFSVEAKLKCPGISTDFPDLCRAPEKACVVDSSEIVLGLPQHYGAGNIPG